MFKFLFFIVFFIVLMTLLMGFSFLRTLKRILFGGGNNEKKSRQQRQATGSTANKQASQQSYPLKQKIFSKDEGEYVDYEEIKE